MDESLFSLFLIKVGDSVIEQGYLAHFGIPGMKWGVRKARSAEIRSRTKTQSKDKGPKRFGVLNAANSAARTYYRKERTGNFKTYRDQSAKLDLKMARLTTDQINNGRYRVARARNITRKAVSGLVGGVTGAALIASGSGFVGAAIGAGAATATNFATGGHYYAKQQKAYGKTRNKYQVKYEERKRING